MTKKQQILNYVQLAGMITSRKMKELQAAPWYLSLLVREGELEKINRGVYVYKKCEFDEKLNLIEVCGRSPRAVICLLSALRYYGFTTQKPFQVWMAIGHKDKTPKINYPPIRVARFSGKALTEGIEIVMHYGIELKIYNPAKTVADCFKCRNKIGTDVAIEALHEGWRRRLFTMHDLHYYSKICRVENVMRPYIESIV